MSDRPLLDLMEQPERRRRNPARPGPGTSHREQVYRELDPAKLQGRKAAVYWLIQRSGVNGLTAKEVASAMGLALNAISGRLSDLCDGGLIVAVTCDGVTVKRNNSIAYRAKESANGK